MSRFRAAADRICHRLLTALLCAASFAAGAQEAPDFPTWLADFEREARAQGISQATFDAALKEVQPLPDVLEKDQKQPEFLATFLDYLDRRLSPTRLERGQALLAEHGVLLGEIQARYGVPPTILVAFWGLETNYGSFLGNHPVPAALATLAFDPRRSDFFRRELLQALALIEAGIVAAAGMKGSWAGAMGQVQFMPSTYMRYAVDGDGDGRRNLWTSTADALASAAHYLHKLGWQAGETWGQEVRLPAGFDIESASLGMKATVKTWSELGVTRADGSPLPDSDLRGAIVLPQGHAGPAFLVYRNFEAIMTWNRSLKYALAVGLLADRLQCLPGVQGGRDADNRPMSLDQVKQLQTLLAAQNLEVGEVDGVPGRKTRLAIRAWQKKSGQPVDGHASMGLLEQLQAGK